MAEKSEIQQFMEKLSIGVGLERHSDPVIGVDSEGGIVLDSPEVKECRKVYLEKIAVKQGRIACCPNCSYIVPLTETTCRAEAGNLFCTICEKEFSENDAIVEARKYKRYEELINKEFESSGLRARILNLKRATGEGLKLEWNTEFVEEMASEKEKIMAIFHKIIPEADRK